MYSKFQDFGYNVIPISNNDDFDFIDYALKLLIDNILKFFGCYSGKTLQEITRKETPWVKTRHVLDKNEICNKTIPKKIEQIQEQMNKTK